MQKTPTPKWEDMDRGYVHAGIKPRVRVAALTRRIEADRSAVVIPKPIAVGRGEGPCLPKLRG